MKKTLSTLVAVTFLALTLAPPAAAQVILTMTTLSKAVTSSSKTTISVASATGITAGSTVLYIADGNSGEAVFVNSVNGTNIGATRGYQSLGAASTHASGALVFVGPPFAFVTVEPTGSCSRGTPAFGQGNGAYLPVIALGLGGSGSSISDCVGGVWMKGIASPTTPFRVLAPNSGGTAYTSLPASTATVAGTLYCTEIDLPASKLLTGIGKMTGTTSTTDNDLVILYDGSGNLLANSNTAGVVSGTVSTYQAIPFLTQYYAVGPAKYFGCVQSNGTHATLTDLVTGTQDTYQTNSYTGVFGTIPATITAPTAFVTATGPYLYVY